jgi:hypothetical protein
MKKRMLVGLAAVTLGGCLMGCKAAKVENFNDAMAFVDKAMAVAHQTNSRVRVDLDWDGRLGAGETTEFFLNSGIRARATFEADASRPGPADCGPPGAKVVP